MDDWSKIVRFQDLRTPVRIPIIIDNVKSTTESMTTSYLIGLYLIVNFVPLDFFMQSGGAIHFTGVIEIKINDTIVSSFLSERKHQIAIKHVLKEAELKLFQVNEFEYFIIRNVRGTIGRFVRDLLRNSFIKIEKQ